MKQNNSSTSISSCVTS